MKKFFHIDERERVRSYSDMENDIEGEQIELEVNEADLEKLSFGWVGVVERENKKLEFLKTKKILDEEEREAKELATRAKEKRAEDFKQKAKNGKVKLEDVIEYISTFN